MEYIKLNNGLRILIYPMLNTHSVTMGLYIKAGSGYETPEQNGITHLLEHMHFRHLNSMTQNELYYKMECMGSSLRGITYRDFMKFSMKFVPDKVKEGVEIFATLISTKEWDDDDFEKEKRVVINQIKEKDTYFSMEDEISRFIFGKSSLSNRIMGTIENVDSFTMKQVIKYKKQVFNQNNMILCITGNVRETDWELVKKKLNTVQIADGIENSALQLPERFQHRKPDICFYMTNEELLDVNISFDVKGKSNSVLLILNCILGEGTGSELQKVLREEKGYTSDIYSYLERYNGFSVLHIRFSVKKKLLKNCLKDIVDVIVKIKHGITKQNLDTALPFYTINRDFLKDDTEDMNFEIVYEKYVLCHEEEKLAEENDAAIIQKVQRLAQSVFAPENVSIVAVGDLTKIKKKKIRKIIRKLEV